MLAQTSFRSAGYVPVSTPPAISSDSTLLLTSPALRLTAAVNYSLQSSIDTSVLSVPMQSCNMFITVSLHIRLGIVVLSAHVQHCFSQQMCAYIRLLDLSSNMTV